MFHQIEGLRVVLSAWVVACHVVMLFQYRVLIQEPDKLHETETSVFFVGARGMGMQVDGFFAISGFLLVYPLLEQIHSSSGTHMFEHVPAASVCAYALVKRLVRMWPPLTVTIALCLFMGDHNIYSLSTVLGLYGFPTFAMDIPVTFGLLWSCRVDIVAGMLLTLICAKTSLLKGGHVKNGVFVFVASLAPKLGAFFASYPAWSYLAKARAREVTEQFVPVFMDGNKLSWVQATFPGAFPPDTPRYTAGPLTSALMQEEYVVAYLRWSPVFAGAVLALALHRATTTSTSTAARMATTWLYRVKHCLFLLVSAVMCLLPWIVATARVLLVSADASSTIPLTGMERLTLTTPSGTLQKVPFGADLLFSVFSRAGFACAMCYLLFRAMLPHGHPLRLGWLNRVLSCISPLGKYSFGVYLLHNRILVSVVMGNLFTTPRLVQWTGSDSPVWHVAVVYAVVLALAGAGAVVMHVVVEKPLAPMTRRVLARVRVLLGIADSFADRGKDKGKGGTKKAD